MNDVMLLAMLGVTSSKALLVAEQQFRKLMTLHSVEQMEAYAAKMPPEAQARLLAASLNGVERIVHDTEGAQTYLEVSHNPSPTVKLARKAYFTALLDHYETVAKHLRDQCIQRAAAGWPEWDYERGCPVGEQPEDSAKPVDLGGLLSGLDLTWLDEPEEQEQSA